MEKVKTTKRFSALKNDNGLGVVCSVNRALKIYPLHSHDYIELEFLVSGRLYQKINGVSLLCESGACWCLDNRDLHCFELIEPVRIYNLCIDPLSVSPAVTEFIGKIRFPLTGRLDDRTLKEASGLFESLSEVTLENGPFAKDKCTAYLLLLLALLSENSSTLTKKAEISGYRYVSAAIEHINANYGSPLTLESVAKAVSLSPKYFSRLFKTVSGHSFVSYLNYTRIEKAKKLLSKTDLSVTFVAMECGFESFPTFSRHFKALCGSTPTAFRNSMRSIC